MKSKLPILLVGLLTLMAPTLGHSQDTTNNPEVCPITGNRNWMADEPFVEGEVIFYLADYDEITLQVPVNLLHAHVGTMRHRSRQGVVPLNLSLAHLPEFKREGCVDSNLHIRISQGCIGVSEHPFGTVCDYETGLKGISVRETRRIDAFKDTTDFGGLYIGAEQTLEEFVADPQPTLEALNIWRDNSVPQLEGGEKRNPRIFWNLADNMKLACRFPGTGVEFDDTYFSNCYLDVVYNVEGVGVEVTFSTWNAHFREYFDEIMYLADNLPNIFNFRRAS